jgi:predicted nucleic acid-binding protein
MILDAEVLVWASRGNTRAARAIDAAPDRALSIVSFMELLQGARSALQLLQARIQLYSKRQRQQFPSPGACTGNWRACNLGLLPTIARG